MYDIALSLYAKYQSMFRFAIVGFINTGVDFLTFSVLFSFLGFNKLICQAAGYTMGIVNSFVLNKLWTFEDRKSKLSTANQFARFVAVNMVSLGLSLLGLKFISESYGVNVYVSKLMVTGVAQAVNYIGYRYWVFNKK
ncbi:GtrA family protein [Caldanaerobius polysaccharolyticus]|uniref:GtrA family protein n=1 Tax=Caldanaerobius polysaccharolyticus TaxID=44256 RepID=UPI00047C8E29|nr:GtrA family protein [Caldanaerobius polysaccharolyticus]